MRWLLAPLALIVACRPSLGPADTVFLHGVVRPMNDAAATAEALAVADGRIVFVGTDADAQQRRSTSWTAPSSPG